MATPFDTRLSQVVRMGVTDTLKPLGFRKRGIVYRREVNELRWLIDVQKSGSPGLLVKRSQLWSVQPPGGPR